MVQNRFQKYLPQTLRSRSYTCVNENVSAIILGDHFSAKQQTKIDFGSLPCTNADRDTFFDNWIRSIQVQDVPVRRLFSAIFYGIALFWSY